MPALFGKDLDEDAAFVSKLWSELNKKTVANVGPAQNPSEDHFKPWDCLKICSLCDSNSFDIEEMEYRKGDLITDPYQLNAIKHLLLHEGSLITENMPIDQSEWPVMVDIKHRRQDAISSFQEGRVLLSTSPFLDELYSNLIEFVVPLDRDKPSGYDSSLARGVIFRTFPEGRTGLLAGFQLAHGLGHQVGMSLFSIDSIFDSDPEKEIFYEVRHDIRTAEHAFVSATALAFMTILSRTIYGDRARPFISDDHVSGYAEHLPDALSAAVRSLRNGCVLTEFGEKTVNGMASLIY